MTTALITVIACDHPGCTGLFRHDTARFVTARRRAKAAGWTRRGEKEDLCPLHKST